MTAGLTMAADSATPSSNLIKDSFALEIESVYKRLFFRKTELFSPNPISDCSLLITHKLVYGRGEKNKPEEGHVVFVAVAANERPASSYL